MSIGRAREAARTHWALCAVLAVAVVVRVLVAVAYRPGLFYPDSWSYIDWAWGDSIALFDITHPLGYSLLLRIIALPGQDLAVATSVQHLAGLATGVVLYGLLVRLGVGRTWAAAGAAVVLLDAYLIALEQTLMPEAFFGLALILGAYLSVGRDRPTAELCAGGLILGATVGIRTVFVFAIPIWLIYVIWAQRRRSGPALAAACLSIVVPVLLIAGAHAAHGGGFGLTSSQGWFLYGRIGEISKCGEAEIPSHARSLCPRSHIDRVALERGWGSLFWIWDPRSPARRQYPVDDGPGNEVAGDFAKAIIRDRPAQYAGLVLGDFLRYFSPGVGSKSTSDFAIELPEEPRTSEVFLRPEVQRRRVPDYRPEVHAPAALVRAYAGIFHVPRWLLAILTVIAAFSVVAGIARRGARIRHRREVFVLSGMALAMLLGASATSEFVLRYLIPVVPLLIAGGGVAAWELWTLVRERRSARRPQASGSLS